MASTNGNDRPHVTGARSHRRPDCANSARVMDALEPVHHVAPPNRIAELRRLSMFLRREVADQLGVPADVLKAWEHRDHVPHEQQQELAAIFGVSTAWLMREES